MAVRGQPNPAKQAPDTEDIPNNLHAQYAPFIDVPRFLGTRTDVRSISMPDSDLTVRIEPEATIAAPSPCAALRRPPTMLRK